MNANIENLHLICNHLLTEAVQQNDMKQLTELFSSKQPFRPAELTSALETAVLKKSDDYSTCIELLLEKGANPGGVNGLGTPFLYIAADAGCEVIVDLLLRAQGDPNQCKDDGTTALHRAVWNGHLSIIEMLVQAGADLEQVDIQGRTPLILAAQRDRTEALEQLLAVGCNPGAADKKGRNALYWSARYNNVRNISALLDSNVDINSQDLQKYTALMIATERGFTNAVELLLDHAADPDIININKVSALMLATNNGNEDCVRLLVDFGADVNTRDSSGATPLLYLIMNDSQLVYHLLEAGADPNISPHVVTAGQTAALIAVAGNRDASLKVLLQLNCDFLSITPKGSRLPLDDALRRGYFECVCLLYTASVCAGADLNWLRTRLKALAAEGAVTSGGEVERCYNWLARQTDSHDLVPTLFNLTRGRLRNCIDPVFFEDNLESLPIPTVLQRALRFPELDNVNGCNDLSR